MKIITHLILILPIGLNAQSIVFTSVRNSTKSLYTLNLADGKEKRISRDDLDYEYPSVSPNGKSIVFLRGEDRSLPVYANPTLEIYLMNTDGTNVRRLTNNNMLDHTAAWSHDGRKIFFASKFGKIERLMSLSADGSHEEFLTDTLSSNVRPRPSPDGRYIVFHTYRYGNDNPEQYRMQFSDGSFVRLTDSPGWDYESSFSPDGSKIAFSSNRHGGKAEIYLMDTDGRNPRKITALEQDCWGATFSPDGKQILFYAGTSKLWQLHLINSDGIGLRRIGLPECSNYGGDWLK